MVRSASSRKESGKSKKSKDLQNLEVGGRGKKKALNKVSRSHPAGWE